MRAFFAVLATLAIFSLPLFAQAGDDCPYSKQETTTASVDAPAVHAAHEGACPAACPYAAAVAEAEARSCACGHAAEALQTAEGDAPQSTQPSADQAVATTD